MSPPVTPPPARARRLSADQRAVEWVANALVTAALFGFFLIGPAIADLLARIPDPRVLWELLHVRSRRIR